MNAAQPRPNESACAPEGFRDALAELVQIGLSVARMIGRVADAAAALPGGAVEACPAVAVSLAEAIEADRVAVAASEAAAALSARLAVVAGAFARVSRSVRLTVSLVERMDRGWARRERDDRAAMARRQIARGVADAIEREAEGERAERLTEALSDRMESLDVERELGGRPAEEVIAEICRDLGLDPARMVVRPLLGGEAREEPAGLAGEDGPALVRDCEQKWAGLPPQRRPDG